MPPESDEHTLREYGMNEDRPVERQPSRLASMPSAQHRRERLPSELFEGQDRRSDAPAKDDDTVVEQILLLEDDLVV